MRKYLRSLKTNVILPYNSRILAAGGVEVVTEKEAYPEKFAPAAIAERKRTVDLTVPEETVKPPVSPELDYESTRRLKAPRMANSNKTAAIIAGLEGAF